MPTCSRVSQYVSTTLSSKCHCPLQTIFTTITKSAFSNSTSSPTHPTGTDSNTGSATPTCSLARLPNKFLLKDVVSGYLSVDLMTNSMRGVRSPDNATVFHVNATNDGSINGIDQLAFNTSGSDSHPAVEYSAWIQYGGSRIQFFNSSSLPQSVSGYAIVTASFSTYLCQMSLITWMQHDLSYPESCGGVLWLDGGLIDPGCKRTRVTVSQLQCDSASESERPMSSAMYPQSKKSHCDGGSVLVVKS